MVITFLEVNLAYFITSVACIWGRGSSCIGIFLSSGLGLYFVCCGWDMTAVKVELMLKRGVMDAGKGMSLTKNISILFYLRERSSGKGSQPVINS